MTAVSLMLVLIAAVPGAGKGLTEAEAVSLGLEHPSFVAVQEARLRAADGSVAAAGRWDNPEVEFSQEKAESPNGDATDRFLWIRQRLNVAGVRGLERRASESGRNATGSERELDMRQRSREVRRAFYRALSEERRKALISRWSIATADLRDTVAARMEQGDASRFDLLRLSREASSVQARLAQAEVAALQARSDLFVLLDMEPRPLDGTLLPPNVAPPFLPEAHPLAAALAHQEEQAQWTSEAAGRARWPEVTVGVGHLDSESPGFDADGPLLGLEVEIPLFQRGTPERQIAIARMDESHWEREMAMAKMATQYDASVQALLLQRDAATNLAATSDDAILRIARAAYENGEISVTELLDAYQSQIQAQLQAVEMALDARQTWIDLTYLTGESK